jgi:hypothetical protein
MKGLSFTTIIRAAIEKSKNKQFESISGTIETLDFLLNKENLDFLEKSHDGLFSFLAFHPEVDQLIFNYLQTESLSTDSGNNILVLFFSKKEFFLPRKIDTQDLEIGITISRFIHPAYQAVEMLFSPQIRVELPGLIFFDRLMDIRESIYIPLQGLESVSQVADRCRKIFSIAHNTLIKSQTKDRKFFNEFSLELLNEKINYKRSQNSCFREWLIKSYHIIAENKGTIITVVPSLKINIFNKNFSSKNNQSILSDAKAGRDIHIGNITQINNYLDKDK